MSKRSKTKPAEPHHNNLIGMLRRVARDSNLLTDILDPTPLASFGMQRDWRGSTPGNPSLDALRSILLHMDVACGLLRDELERVEELQEREKATAAGVEPPYFEHWREVERQRDEYHRQLEDAAELAS